MAKGNAAKAEIQNKILELFGDNAFLSPDKKEIRICTIENGEEVQIKLTMTCAKNLIERETKVIKTESNEEEKEKVIELCKKLNILKEE